MRQIPLKTLRATLTKELLNLPFEITSYGKVVGVVLKKWKIEVEGLNQPVKNTKGLNNKDKGLNNNKVVAPPENFLRYFNPQPKKGKK